MGHKRWYLWEGHNPDGRFRVGITRTDDLEGWVYSRYLSAWKSLYIWSVSGAPGLRQGEILGDSWRTWHYDAGHKSWSPKSGSYSLSGWCSLCKETYRRFASEEDALVFARNHVVTAHPDSPEADYIVKGAWL